jgi:hypothetical protein
MGYTQTATLDPGEAAQGLSVGNSVEMSGAPTAFGGRVVVLGAPGIPSLDRHPAPAGKAYVFVLPDAGWRTGEVFSPVATLVPSDNPGNGVFGMALAVSHAGDLIAVGSRAGKVYLYAPSGGSWSGTLSEVAVLESADASSLGFDVAMDAAGETIAAAAPSTNPSVPQLYVFSRPGSGWSGGVAPIASRTAPAQGVGGNAAGEVHLAISAAGDLIAAAGEWTAGFVYARPGAAWSGRSLPPDSTLTPSDAAPDPIDFACSVAMDAAGQTIVVGAQQYDVTPNSYRGAVFLYQPGSFGWSGPATETARLYGATLPLASNIGDSVATDGRIVVAMPYSPASEGREAYVFQQPTDGWSGTVPPDSSLVPTGAFMAGVATRDGVIITGTYGPAGAAVYQPSS